MGNSDRASHAAGSGQPRLVRGLRRGKSIRHEAMRRQFAPPGSGNKALQMHQRLTGKAASPEVIVPARVRAARPREARERRTDPEVHERRAVAEHSDGDTMKGEKS
jgi:hypothetical protein